MTTTDPRPTHLLAVVGKAIARETNIQPSPVVIRPDVPADRARVEEVMRMTVRRCFRHRPDLALEVEWNGPAKAAVYVIGLDRRAEVAARFTIRPITPADIAAVGAPTIPKELVP